MFLNFVENFGVTEEIGDAGEKVAEQRRHFRRSEFQIANIVFQPVDLMYSHAPFHTTPDRVLLVLRKVMTRVGTQQEENLVEGFTRF